MLQYPDEPGFNFRDTSKQAAEEIKPKAAAIRIRVLREIQYWQAVGATCDEIEQHLGLSHQTASARIRELNMAGHIVDSGYRRKTRSGRNAIIWLAKEQD